MRRNLLMMKELQSSQALYTHRCIKLIALQYQMGQKLHQTVNCAQGNPGCIQLKLHCSAAQCQRQS